MPTKRVEGRRKKKSIKAKIRPNMGSKQRTMRLGAERKKGDRGATAAYLSRAQILRRLQLSLKDFRRLCILKGIYPRDPPRAVNRLGGKSKTYYHVKDVQHLAHEPLIASFRKFKAFMKKLKKTIGRGVKDEAVRRESVSKPTYTLDHLVKERYPRFIDALRDLDDALSLINLFATLPQVKRDTSKKVEACQRILQEWQLYCTRAKCLKKVFVSIKGIYFQCNIQGQPVTWISPHAFSQHYPKDVDFSVMLTFLDFYLILFRFVLFRLYGDVGLRYPPRIDETLENLDAGLVALRPLEIGTMLEDDENILSGVAKVDEVGSDDERNINSTDAATRSITTELDSKMDNILNTQREVMEKEESELLRQDVQHSIQSGDEEVDEDEEGDDDMDEMKEDVGLSEQLAGDISTTLHTLIKGRGDEDGNDLTPFASDSPDNDNPSKVFEGLCFYLGREVPRQWIAFTILSCGGKVGWEGQGSPYCESSDSVTHQVVDRPLFKHPSGKRREYIQPQWIFDSINTGMRLPVERYNTGATLPPHLSPFVDDEEQGYVPQYREELRRLRSGTTVSSIPDNKGEKKSVHDDNEEVAHEPSEEDEETIYARELEQEAIGVSYSMAGNKAAVTMSEGKKKTGVKHNKRKNRTTVGDDSDSASDSQHQMTEKEHDHELARVVMSKKAKRIYDRMKHGINKKKESADKLKEKRESLSKKGKN